jgi:hypothetical protein
LSVLKLLDEIRQPDYSSRVFRARLLLLFTLFSCATALAASEPMSDFTVRFQALIDNKEARNDVDRLHRLFNRGARIRDPGHFQMSIAQEMEDLSEFRKYGWYTAFGEGWTLYGESLGYEIGFFKDPYQNFGHLSDEIMRAVRLVVDTGLHSMNWTRDQAIKYFEENTGNPLHDVEVEVDRYIVWPSQALGYKIGQMKIRELRSYAEKELGEKFDLRAFHDEVVENGVLPLSVPETHIKDWIIKRKAA